MKNMRFGGATLEDFHDNIENAKNNICKLNGKKISCLPPNLIISIHNKTNNTNIKPKSKPHNLIIDKIAENCGCEKKNTTQEKELCIIENIDEKIINEDQKDCIKYKFFKPEGSHNGNDWLNNTHIDIIQEQLYQMFPDYEYGFIHMIDNVMIIPQNAKCLNHKVRGVTDIDFEEEVKNNTMKWYGVVYNTDPSHKSGQHWFAILFNFTTAGNESDPYLIEYFNSSGLNIQDSNFREFLEDLAFNISYTTGKKTVLKKVTSIQHQKNTTGNCGIFSLVYVFSRLSGIPFDSFNDPNNKVTDNLMVKFRKVLYRKEE